MNSKTPARIVALLDRFRGFPDPQQADVVERAARTVDPEALNADAGPAARTRARSGPTQGRHPDAIASALQRRPRSTDAADGAAEGVVGAAHVRAGETSRSRRRRRFRRARRRASARRAHGRDRARRPPRPQAELGGREKLWKRIREAGLTDDVIKELEKRVAANPKDPDAQTDLGNAYLKKIEEVPQGPESGAWATRPTRPSTRRSRSIPSTGSRAS